MEVRSFGLGSTTVFDVPLLTEYVYWRFTTTGVKGDTIKNDISGINTMLTFLGHGINLQNNNSAPLIRLYRGCNRLRVQHGIGTKAFYRRALVDKMLDPMVRSLKGSSHWVRTVRAMLLFAKHTAFRPMNYVRTSVPEALCCVKHVTFIPSISNPRNVIVTLPQTKTHQIDARFKETRTVQCRCVKGPCPVHELAKLLQDRRAEPEEALFLLANGFPVTYYRLKKIMQLLCQGFDLEWQYYTPYCLRIGEATDRNMRGESLERTMKFVNWKSRKSAMTYIRPDNEDFVKFPDV